MQNDTTLIDATAIIGRDRRNPEMSDEALAQAVLDVVTGPIGAAAVAAAEAEKGEAA
jgi:hypothetical protein